jgi:hypothetical protein
MREAFNEAHRNHLPRFRGHRQWRQEAGVLGPIRFECRQCRKPQSCGLLTSYLARQTTS